MKKEVIIRPEAEAEIKEAYHWYEERHKGLGLDFLLCIEEAIEKISRDPETYPLVHKNVRRILIHRFPYSIFFIEDVKIVVIAVFHAKRNPKKWRFRA